MNDSSAYMALTGHISVELTANPMERENDMINQAQLNELKKCHDMSAINGLVNKWSAELFLKESQKSGNVTFTLKNLRGDESREVVAIQIGESFGLHKDAWGGSFWVLTHIPSGIKVLSGKKATLSAVVKDFAQWGGLNELDEAMKEHGLQALRHVNDNITQEYRAFYERAGY